VTHRGYEFVDRIKRQVDQGGLEIACFPEVANELIRHLDSEFVSVNDIARIVTNEAALAVRVIGMANSAAYRSGGRAITDVRSAITRIGLRAWRGVIFAFAVMQIRAAQQLRPVQYRIGDVWQRSTVVATFSHLLASELRAEHRQLDPELAMLGGLMHGVGKIYILAESALYPELADDGLLLDDIVRAWHAPAAGKLLEQWGLGPQVAEAVTGHDEADEALRSQATLADLLHAAMIFAELRGEPADLARQLTASRACQRLGLFRLDLPYVLQQIAGDAGSLDRVLL
jgi:HD-like signal output (HDOD) protein